MANWWDALDGDTKQALILAGANLGQGYFSDRQEDEERQETRRDSAITNKSEGIRSVLNSVTGDYQFGENQGDNRAQAAARMSGSSPLQFQGDRARMSALGDFLGGAGQADMSGLRSGIKRHMPNGGNPIATTPFSATTKGFFTPESMAAAEQPYWARQAAIDPSVGSPNLGAMGYGGAGTEITNDLETKRAARQASDQEDDEAYQAKAEAQRAALMASLAELDPDYEASQNGAQDDDDDGHGIDWKKWAGIGAGVAGGYLLGR